MEDKAVERILDCGCGAGDSLNELDLLQSAPGAAHVQMVGIDIDMAALRQGKKDYPGFDFVCAKGEQLPFRAETFGVVISRVAVPYMNIPFALREMWLVLKNAGELKIKLHPFSFTWAELIHELRSGPVLNRAKNLIYRCYVIGNGLALHWAGFNFRFPASRRRCESFQTRSGIQRALAAAGFRQIDTSCWATRIIWPHAGDCRARARRQG